MTSPSYLSSLTKSFYRIILFLHSYLPLLLIIFILKIDNKEISLILGFMMFLSMLIFTKFINAPSKKKPSNILNVRSINKSGAEVLNYFATYIIPFIILSFDGIEDITKINTIVALFIMFLILGVLYISSSLYYINPLLSMFYDIYLCKLTNGTEAIIIASKGKKININTPINLREMFNGLYLLIDNEKKFRSKNHWIFISFIALIIVVYTCLNL